MFCTAEKIASAKSHGTKMRFGIQPGHMIPQGVSYKRKKRLFAGRKELTAAISELESLRRNATDIKEELLAARVDVLLQVHCAEKVASSRT